MELDELYQQNILDHYKHPRHKGVPDMYTEKREGSNPSCGDELTIYLTHDGNVINSIMFDGDGCAISQAATSMLMERLTGKPLASLRDLTEEDVYGMLGVVVGPQREKCALLALRTLKQ